MIRRCFHLPRAFFPELSIPRIRNVFEPGKDWACAQRAQRAQRLRIDVEHRLWIAILQSICATSLFVQPVQQPGNAVRMNLLCDGRLNVLFNRPQKKRWSFIHPYGFNRKT